MINKSQNVQCFLFFGAWLCTCEKVILLQFELKYYQIISKRNKFTEYIIWVTFVKYTSNPHTDIAKLI